MKKGKLLVALLSLFAFAGIGLSTLTGCGGKNDDSGDKQGEKFAITWTIPAHATVKMEDGSEPVKEAENGTSIVFTVKVDDGYAIDSVKANNKRVSAKSGKYAVNISKATEIVIAVKESVGELKVTPPTKLTYYAGDEIDLTGMVVEVTYGTGRKETIEYGEGGYSVYPTVFEGGEDHFEVTYSGTTVSVALDKRVEYLVSIDPNGGEIAESWITKVQGMNLNNFAISDKGVVTFTYFNNLPRTINLPTKEEMTRTNYAFTQWTFSDESGTTAISNLTNANVVATAGWQIELVQVDSVAISVENDIPYLSINGKYKASEEVYLYLYEGNDKIELLGPTYTGTSGSDFSAKFDLRELSSKGPSYEGKWMDIRFNASYEGKDTSMEIYVQTVEVNDSDKILCGGFVYTFHNWNGLLKIDFTTFDGRAYTVAGHAVEGKDYLQIRGEGFGEYAGKYVEVSWWTSGETEGYGATISADGQFTIEYPLAILGVTLNTNCYSHIGIYEDNTKEVTLYGGTSQDILVKDIFTSFPSLPKKQGDMTNGFRYVGQDGLTYYVGFAWTQLMVYVVDESIMVENATVELRGGKVYYVVTGECIGYTSETFIYGFYFQHVNNLDGLGDSCVYNDYQGVDPAIDQHAVVEDDKFEMSVCVSDVLAEQFKADTNTKWGLISKYYFGTDTNPIELKVPEISEESVTLDGVKYSLFQDSSLTWNITCLVLEKI